MAIMRLWHGKDAIEKAEEYEKFMISRAAPDYGSVEVYSNNISSVETKIK